MASVSLGLRDGVREDPVQGDAADLRWPPRHVADGVEREALDHLVGAGGHPLVEADDRAAGLGRRHPHVGRRLRVLGDPRQVLVEGVAERRAEVPPLDGGQVLHEAQQVGARRDERPADVVLGQPVELPEHGGACSPQLSVQVLLELTLAHSSTPPISTGRKHALDCVICAAHPERRAVAYLRDEVMTQTGTHHDALNAEQVGYKQIAGPAARPDDRHRRRDRHRPVPGLGVPAAQHRPGAAAQLRVRRRHRLLPDARARRVGAAPPDVGRVRLLHAGVLRRDGGLRHRLAVLAELGADRHRRAVGGRPVCPVLVPADADLGDRADRPGRGAGHQPAVGAGVRRVRVLGVDPQGRRDRGLPGRRAPSWWSASSTSAATRPGSRTCGATRAGSGRPRTPTSGTGRSW